MEAMKRLSSMPAFHHHGGGGDHHSRKKAAAEDNKRATKKEEEKDEESDEERSEGEVEEVKEGREKKSFSRSKSFKMKLLQKMGRGGTSKEEKMRKKNASKESSRKEEMKRKMEREKRKDEMIKTYDKKAQLDSTTTASSSHIKEIPQTVMCGMNLPGYKSHIKRSASSSSAAYPAGAAATNNRGRQGDRQSNSSNPLLINDEKERRRAEARERHHRELRLGAVLSSNNPANSNRSPSPTASSSSSSPSSEAQKKNDEETAKKREKHRSSFLALGHGAARRAEAAAATRSASPPATSAGQAWVKGTSGSGDQRPTPTSPPPSCECDYSERGEEGIDLMELQRQFQQVGGSVGPGVIDEERRVRLAEDRVKGAARLPWWGLNASSGKEGRRKEWERFFSGFKVSELWEDDEGEDDDDEDDDDPCRGKKVAYLTEETTVKEALDVMSERGLNALPICLKEVDDKAQCAKAGRPGENGGGTEEDEVRERALRHLRKWRKAELARERERKQRKQRGKTVLGWIDLRDLLTFAVFKFPRPPSADIGIDEVRRQGVEFTQHKIRELVNIYGTNGAHVVNDEGTGGQGGHRIAANDRMPAVFRMLRSEKGLRVLPVYDQSQLPAESRCLVRVLDTKVVIRWLHRVVQDNRARSPFVRELANRQVRHWGAFADAILGKELIYFETEEMINNFDHFRASKRERRMSKLIVPFGSVDGGSTVEVVNTKKNPSPPPTPNDGHPKEKLDLNKHLFTISADRSVIDAFKIIYNYKVSALGVLEKKGKERNVDDESSSDSDSYDSEEEESESSSSSSSSGEEEERVKRRKDQEKARGPSLKEAKAMVEAARDSSSDDDDESSSESDSSSDDSSSSSSEDELGDNTETTTTSTTNHHPNHQRSGSPKRTSDSQALSSHTKPTRSQSDPLGLNASKRANAHDASDTAAKAKTHHGPTSKDRKQPGSRSKRAPAPARITREEMVVRAAQAGKLISHLSSSDLKNFEPFAMMRCLHMSIKEYLACFKDKKPLVTCRRDTTLLQLLEKMAREEVNRIWLLADEDDDDDDEDEEGDKGHDRKAKHEPNKPKDNVGGRPIGMISLADIIAEVTRL